VPFLQLACVWGSVLFLSTLYTQLIYARGKSDWYLYGTLLSGLLQLAAVVGLYRWGIYAIVVGSVVGNFIGLGFWQYCVSKLIRLRLRDVLKDTLPYLAVSGCCFFVAWLLTRGIGNLYVLMTAKVCISILLYIVGLRYSRSVLYRESLSFLLGRFNTRKGRGL
jgi:O-antigen/teichoic acid export membrane protein